MSMSMSSSAALLFDTIQSDSYYGGDINKGKNPIFSFKFVGILKKLRQKR